MPAYYGGKRKSVSIIFNRISKVIPREKWYGMVFVDAFLGSAAVSLYAKSQGFRIICNDIATRSYIAGKALIESNTMIKNEDIQKLFLPNEHNRCFIEENYAPNIFAKRHAVFLDLAFANADTELLKYLLIKYIFLKRNGKPFINVRKSFDKLLEKCGIINIRFHDLRHTFASQLAMAGVDLNTIRELLGHKSIQMTLRYAHLSPDHKRKAVDTLMNRLGTNWAQKPSDVKDEKLTVSQLLDNK